MYCKYCGIYNQDGLSYCQNCNMPLTENGQAAPMPATSVNKYGMGWHKFLINFALFFGALVNLITAVKMLTGLQYGEIADAVYLYYTGLKALDVIFGIAFIGLSAFMIYTRFQLSGLRRGAPTKLIIIYAASLVLSAVYLLIATVITGINLIDASSAASFATSITILCINISYYRNRAELFVN